MRRSGTPRRLRGAQHTPGRRQDRPRGQDGSRERAPGASELENAREVSLQAGLVRPGFLPTEALRLRPQNTRSDSEAGVEHGTGWPAFPLVPGALPSSIEALR